MATFFTLHGRFRLIDLVWQLSTDVVAAAAPDPTTGSTRWQPVMNVLGRLPYFGVDEGNERWPTFLSKELAQDLLDTPVFEGGRARVADLRTCCPAGPGAKLGLMLLFNLPRTPTQRQAIPLMRSLLESASGPGGWAHGNPSELELHDIQFMLCELQKFLTFNARNSLRYYRCGAPAPSALPRRRELESLEEALLLFGPGARAVSAEELLQLHGCWQGLPAQAAGPSEGLRSGDRVRLREAGGARLLALGSGRQLRPAASTAEAVAVVLERSGGPGLARPGDEVFLRAPDGTHLAARALAGGRCVVDAPLASGRYCAERAWRLQAAAGAAAGGGSGASGTAEQALGLQPCRGELAGGTLQFSRDGRLACAPPAPRGGGQPVVLEADLRGHEALERVRHEVWEALQEGLRTGRLVQDAEGALALGDAGGVRRRLVGAAG
ncbi:unnamed protein product [Prorocentrum cordatum]|uniref:Uncharacterized protein n=1 Tax=Prorocentrum cordatum TaxID=2364126 RepID=A0ABN9WHB5_9DINO|nr:unnamed protein product [Polarella glacialis]